MRLERGLLLDSFVRVRRDTFDTVEVVLDLSGLAGKPRRQEGSVLGDKDTMYPSSTSTFQTYRNTRCQCRSQNRVRCSDTHIWTSETT